MDNIVTVIIPSYKRAHLLKQTIPTYLQEGVKELIIVDDCSPDNTTEVVKELQSIYPQIRYIRQPRNMKQAAAKNRAMEEVHTEWIYFGDDDSVLYPNTIRTLYDTCNDYQADICGCSAYYMNPGDENLSLEEYLQLVRKWTDDPCKIVDLENLKANFELSYTSPVEVPFCQACLLVKSEIAQKVKFDPLYLGNAYREETDFIVRCAAAGAKIMYNSEAAQINLPPSCATGGAHVSSKLKYKRDVVVNTWRFLDQNYPFFQNKYHLSKSLHRMKWDCLRREITRTIKSFIQKK